ncbi:major facilitator superfamily domain-containing protein, partial [Mycena rebaudengoi]
MTVNSLTQEENVPPLDAGVDSYSLYTRCEKWFVVSLIAFGGLFSPLSMNIYLPAIPTLSEAFHKSIELINLTVTTFMIFQALSPMLWGTLSDTYGRRHLFILCLLLLAASCVGLALTPANDYWLLLLLRCLQSTGSASTIAIGAGVIGDISTRADRGGFLGVYTVGPMVGPAIGPVLGGVLADKLGWRAIFWFLCIASAICMIVIILFLPETLHTLVGNGSVAPSAIYTPVIPVIGRHIPKSSATTAARKKFQNPLRILTHIDILILLLANGITFAVYIGVTASLSNLFHIAYPQLNETQLGLCYLTVGSGTIVGSILSGKVLDWDYERFRRTMLAAGAIEPGAEKELDDAFPIEKARMRLLPFFLLFFIASCVGYGWCVDRKTHIAGPLLLLFGVAFVTIYVLNACQALLLDLMPAQGSAITACNNLIRWGFSATLIAVIQPILNALGTGYTYLLLGGIAGLVAPLVFCLMRVGPKCRAKRR